MVTVVASGYFDPIHTGHLNYLESARKLGDKLIVIVNNDHQAALKKGKPFMPEGDRLEIVKNLRMVDDAVLSVDRDRTVTKTLKILASREKEVVFVNGGDVEKPCPEETRLSGKIKNIRFVYGTGGEKTRSSSAITGQTKVDEKLEFCLNETRKALDNIRVKDKKAEELLKFARDYYNDALHYKQKDPLTALEAVAYAHGFIDSCVILGLAEIPGYHLTAKE